MIQPNPRSTTVGLTGWVGHAQQILVDRQLVQERGLVFLRYTAELRVHLHQKQKQYGALMELVRMRKHGTQIHLLTAAGLIGDPGLPAPAHAMIQLKLFKRVPVCATIQHLMRKVSTASAIPLKLNRVIYIVRLKAVGLNGLTGARIATATVHL